MDTSIPRQASQDDLGQAPLAVTSPACCCPATPVVRVVLPPTLVRPHPTDLLLCGHHYRVSRQRLAALSATVEKLPGMAGDAVALFLSEEVPSSPVPVI